MSGSTVWLASYMKSGNTWFRAVHSAWATGADPDVNGLVGGPIASSREVLDATLGISTSDLTTDEIDALRPRADEAFCRATTEPLLRKVHDAYFLGPTGEPVLSVAATRGAVYIIRDPRDVAVSYSHHSGRSLQRIVEQMGDPAAAADGDASRLRTQVRQRTGTWSDHVRSWLDEAPFPVHTIRYEDCTRDPVPFFAAGLRAAGFDASDEDVAVAVERSAFDRLQTQERERGFIERPRADSRFFRTGKVGGWREELPAALARRIEDEHTDVMARFGYDA